MLFIGFLISMCVSICVISATITLLYSSQIPEGSFILWHALFITCIVFITIKCIRCFYTHRWILNTRLLLKCFFCPGVDALFRIQLEISCESFWTDSCVCRDSDSFIRSFIHDSLRHAASRLWVFPFHIWNNWTSDYLGKHWGAACFGMISGDIIAE